jgi:undecaprenyl-diphosphatase
MTTFDVIKAIVLGIVEGLTEFIPVSSTGHLLLVQHFFGFGDEDFGKSFAVLIQLGAILALLSIYFARLWQLFLGMFNDPHGAALHHRRADGLPAGGMVIGALAYGFIKSVLFNPWIVCTMLIVGGFVLLWSTGSISSRATTTPKVLAADVSRHRRGQCLSMVPGVSRSGATIVGAMLFGADRRAGAEFSFWLAMPTMAGAFAFDL